MTLFSCTKRGGAMWEDFGASYGPQSNFENTKLLTDEQNNIMKFHQSLYFIFIFYFFSLLFTVIELFVTSVYKLILTLLNL